MVNATYLKPTYLHAYSFDSGDSSDRSDISGISDSNDSSDQKTVSLKNFFYTQICHLLMFSHFFLCKNKQKRIETSQELKLWPN